jgi:murein DD-endopeptidase MepM/ murein hydrolase activator NlpD
VGRHSPTRSPRAQPASDRPASAVEQPQRRLTRTEERALARRVQKLGRSRPVWRRTPVIPAAAVVLLVWGGGDAYHLLARPSAASAKTAADVKVDLSALATGQLAQQIDGGSRRVSRSVRTDSESAQQGASQALPARPSLPKVDPGKTVMGTWIRPSAGGMSSCFCERWGVFHEGIDLAGPLGSPIVAVGDGVVLEAGPSAGFGHWILIQHANGDVSVYGHMYTVLVTKGEHVTAGQHIADIGSDGQSTGPHLHFGVMRGRENGPYIDPVPWLKARGVDVGQYNPNA